MEKMAGVGTLSNVYSLGGSSNSLGGNFNDTSKSESNGITGGEDTNKNNASSLDSPAATVDTQNNNVDTKNNNKDSGASKDTSTEYDLTKEEDVKRLVEDGNKMLEEAGIKLRLDYHKRFDYNEEAGMFAVAVIDPETEEVIKELPPEEMVKNIIKGRIWMDAFIGTFIDKMA
jgi:flagellar protein FlaG